MRAWVEAWARVWVRLWVLHTQCQISKRFQRRTLNSSLHPNHSQRNLSILLDLDCNTIRQGSALNHSLRLHYRRLLGTHGCSMSGTVP